MKHSFRLAAPLAVLLAFACGCARRPALLPQQSAAGWRVVRTPGVRTRLISFDLGPGAGPALRLDFIKTGDERRFIALEGMPAGDPATAKALSVMYRLTLEKGDHAKLALLMLERDGGAWLRIGGAPLATDAALEARLPLEGMRRAQFARDADTEPRFDQAERFQVGIVMDGPARGSLELGRIAFTAEPYKPTAPVPIPFADAAMWRVGKDPAAQCTLTPGTEGPSGKPSMRIAFAFPGGRHMYACPALSLDGIEFDGYRAVRFIYKAELPPGIGGLLVCLNERGDGSQYYAHPAPPPSEEWMTTEIALDYFKLGNWSKDENSRLDPGEVGQLVIGVHGTATQPKASGWIVISGLELVP